MKTKNIWLWSIVIGLIASTALYMLFGPNHSSQAVEAAPTDQALPTISLNQESSPAPAELPEYVNNILNIGKGKRAITVTVNEAQGVKGFIQPGSHVDIVSVITSPSPSSSIIVSGIRVLAVDSATSSESTNTPEEMYTTVTLEVAPEQGAQIALATHQGNITLLLHGNPSN